MVSSHEEDDNSSSSSDSDEKELENRAVALEQQISENKYLYEIHAELVELYRKLGDLKSMRAAHERFAEYYPLTPTIWLAWLKDEIKLQADKVYILSLFDKAVDDYLSISIWLEYIQYCIGNCELEQTYAVIEKGLSAGGLHVSEGSLLWAVLLELEVAQLSLHEPLCEPWKQQVQKVSEAFRRQLSVPLLDMENTHTEWKVWLQQLPEGHGIESQPTEWGYQKALKLLDKYKRFEEQLLVSQDNEEIIYCIYQDYLKAVNDPATNLCLYERAVAQLSLNVSVWTDYCTYAFKLGDVADNISKRSLRNCPWDEALWVLRIRILEQQSYLDKDVTSCLEQGLISISPCPGINLWLSYLEFLRRSLSTLEHMNKAFLQVEEHLGEDGDPTFKISKLHARICSRNGDMAQSRRIWSKIMRQPTYKTSATAWIEYAALEKQFGDAQHLRTLYERAIVACTDWPQYIAEDWLMYERECGSLQDILKCEEKCKKAIIVSKEPPSETFVKGKKRSHDNNDKSTMVKRMKTVEISVPPPPNQKMFVSDIDSEKSVFVSNMREDVGEDRLLKVFPNAVRISIPCDRRGNSRCYGYVQFPSTEDVENALTRDREPIDGRPLYISKCLRDQTQRGKFKYSTRGEENKLFVRGLPLNYAQEDVENLFKPHGAVAVRLVLRKNGRSKGLAYIEFPDVDKASAAIKATDQLNLDGYTISVAVSAPPAKQSEGNFESNPEPVRHARSRLQVPLVPRSIQTKKPEESVTMQSKSNEDFRKMLLNK